MLRPSAGLAVSCGDRTARAHTVSGERQVSTAVSNPTYKRLIPNPASEHVSNAGTDRPSKPARSILPRSLATSAAATHALAVGRHPTDRCRSLPTADHAELPMASEALRSCAMERRLHLQPGASVIIEGQRSRITQVMDLETVLVEDVETAKARQVKIQELQPEGLSPETPGKAESVELVDITEHEWQRAHERFEIIRPLLDDPDCTRAKVRARAALAGRHPATLYRWLEQYRRGGRGFPLLPAKRGVGWGEALAGPRVGARRAGNDDRGLSLP